ncbi:MAG: hypothetical protein Q9217_002027 [Psora testacea]
MSGTPTRRSGRRHVQNQKYKEATETLETLNNVLSSDSEEELLVRTLQADPKDDEDFTADQAVPPSDSPDSPRSEASDGSDSSAIATPLEDYEDAHSYASSETDAPRSGMCMHRRSKAGKQQHGATKEATRSRGIPETALKTDNKISRLHLLSGPARKDVMHLVRSGNQWGNDVTLPRRSRMRLPFSHTEEKREFEGTVGWDWYYEQGGKEAYAERQRLRGLSADEAARYLPKRASHNLLMGPYGRQKLFHISTLDSLNVDDAWKVATGEHTLDDQERPRKRRRHGWLLNVGRRVRSLDWAANQDGDIQYLAIATKSAMPKGTSTEAPAFTPASGTPSGVHIWAFAVSQEFSATESTIESSRPPKLKQVLCTDWGDVKQLKWCPTPRSFRNEEADGKVPLGLLAGVWDDGCARVLDVQLDRDQNSGSTYSETPRAVVNIESAAFTAEPPPNSICTCLAWLSATDLAVGHSNGYLSIYSIVPTSPLTPRPPDTDTAQDVSSSTTDTATYPQPWLHIALHQTYIIAITSAYPSFPTLLASTSMSGHTRLTSLLDPQTSYVQSRRTQTPGSTILYHDGLYGCIYPDDGKENITFTGLRFWGNAIGFGKAAGWGGLSCVDVGKVHAVVAFGTADGRIVVTNPIRKVLTKKKQGYQQTLFRHEWVCKQPQAASDAVVEEPGDEDTSYSRHENEREGRKGTSRITEGYKPHSAETHYRYSSRRLFAGGSHGVKGTMTTTIFEEETGATAVCWNPNLSCGGWLAVGWGSGLIRVEDVGI